MSVRKVITMDFKTLVNHIENNKEAHIEQLVDDNKKKLEEIRDVKKKFTIKCNSCGSENCELEAEYMECYREDYETEDVYMGTKIHCLNCGKSE
jgi:uncharacterized protein YktB (UPF0637 family)